MSPKAKVEDVEIDKNVFAFQAAELELAAFGAFQLEVGRFISNSQCGSEASCGKNRTRRNE